MLNPIDACPALPGRPAYAHTERGTIHYLEAGSGPPLLLLHATPGSHRAFHALMPLLATRFRTIAVDTPGYGNSAPLPGPVSVDEMARSMVALLDALSLPRTHVLGLHTGNKIGAALAADWPQRVHRVVLAGQTHSLIVDRSTRDAAIRELVDHYFPRFATSGLSADGAVRSLSADGAHHVRQWLMVQADVLPLWWPPALLAGAAVTAEQVANAESMVIDHLLGWRSIVPTYEAIFDFDLAAAMRRMTAPTLVLELHSPHEAHFGAQAPLICSQMFNAQPLVLQGLDAGVFRSQPQTVADAVIPFLSAS